MTGTSEILLSVRSASKIDKMGEVDVPALRDASIDIRVGEFLIIESRAGGPREMFEVEPVFSTRMETSPPLIPIPPNLFKNHPFGTVGPFRSEDATVGRVWMTRSVMKVVP